MLERQHCVLSRIQFPSAQLRYWESSAWQPLVQRGVEGAEEPLDYGFVGGRFHRCPANAGANVGHRGLERCADKLPAIVDDDRRRAYIVDCVRQLSCGAIELIEVKNDRRALRDLDYQLKLQCVRAICEQVGWRFRIVLKQGLFEPELRYANILDVQSWKLTNYSATDVFRVVDHLDRHSPSPLGRLTELIGGPLVGAAKLKAMMVGRIVRLDLSKPITPQTLVERIAQSRDRAEEAQ